MTENARVRAVIVDDEPLARERLADLLSSHGEVEIAGSAADGVEAVKVLEALHPQIVFLDIAMPGLDGFEVLEALATGSDLPLVIFTTAYDEFAIRAFDAHAVDYLLKPVEADRLAFAVARAVSLLRVEEASSALERMITLVHAAHGPHPMKRLAVRERDRLLILTVSSIDYIAAEGNYVRLHTAGRSHLLRSTMQSLESDLDPQEFVRIHRGLLVNAARIAEISPGFGGNFFVVLQSGVQLEMQRAYAGRLRSVIGRM